MQPHDVLYSPLNVDGVDDALLEVLDDDDNADLPLHTTAATDAVAAAAGTDATAPAAAPIDPSWNPNGAQHSG